MCQLFASAAAAVMCQLSLFAHKCIDSLFVQKCIDFVFVKKCIVAFGSRYIDFQFVQKCIDFLAKSWHMLRFSVLVVTVCGEPRLVGPAQTLPRCSEVARIS